MTPSSRTDRQLDEHSSRNGPVHRRRRVRRVAALGQALLTATLSARQAQHMAARSDLIESADVHENPLLARLASMASMLRLGRHGHDDRDGAPSGVLDEPAPPYSHQAMGTAR
jgi:hypothetical protein